MTLDPTLGIAALTIVVILAAIVGAVAGVATYFGGTRGERARFEGELAPLRTSIADVADRFEHWTKRERRRDAVSAPTGPQGLDSDPSSPSGRANKLRQIAMRFGRR